MADNEGPKRSDFQEASKLPGCGEHCAEVHGDQADPEQLELMHLRAEVKRLRSTSQELEIDRLRAESAEWQRKYEVTEKLKEQLANVPAGGPSRELVIITLAGVIQEREQLRAEVEFLCQWHYPFNVREALRRRDLPAIKAIAAQSDAFLRGLQDAQIERDRLERVARELHTDRDQLWALSEDRGRVIEGCRAETDRLRAELAAKPDPEGGAAAKRELEWMRPKLAEAEAALKRSEDRRGWGFLGPCVHGRDPFDRCDTCGELEPYQAAQLVEREAGAAFLELNAGNATLDTTGVERKTLLMAARLLRERGGGA